MSNILAQTYQDMVTVTPSDTTADPAGPFHGLLVSVAGTLKIHTLKGSDTSVTVVAGQYVVVACSRVWSTGTTATVVGLIARTP